MKKINSLLLMSSSLLLSSYCMADITAEFHGKLIEMPCAINNDATLEFDFGRVGINKIDGDTKRGITEPLKVECQENITDLSLILEVSGTQMSSSPSKSNILKTNVANLGVAIVNGNNDEAIELNKPYTIGKGGSVVFPLKAVLTKDDDSLPIAVGVLNTTATVVASYE